MVTKTPEPVDPMDPSKGVTDFTLYAMSETYAGMEGCAAHMDVAGKTGDILPRFMETVTKYATVYKTETRMCGRCCELGARWPGEGTGSGSLMGG